MFFPARQTTPAGQNELYHAACPTLHSASRPPHDQLEPPTEELVAPESLP
jgi:hypothetical protein